MILLHRFNDGLPLYLRAETIILVLQEQKGQTLVHTAPHNGVARVQETPEEVVRLIEQEEAKNRKITRRI